MVHVLNSSLLQSYMGSLIQLCMLDWQFWNRSVVIRCSYDNNIKGLVLTTAHRITHEFSGELLDTIQSRLSEPRLAENLDYMRKYNPNFFNLSRPLKTWCEFVFILYYFLFVRFWCNKNEKSLNFQQKQEFNSWHSNLILIHKGISRISF